MLMYMSISNTAGGIHTYQLVSSSIMALASAAVVPSTSLLHIRTKVPSFTLSIFWLVCLIINVLYTASVSTLGAGFLDITAPIAILSLQIACSLAAVTLESIKKTHFKKYPSDELSPDYNMNIFQRLFLLTIPRLALIALKRDITIHDIR